MAIMTHEEELAWIKVSAAAFALGGYVLSREGPIRMTFPVEDLPNDKRTLKIKDMAQRLERTHLMIEVNSGGVHVRFLLADDLDSEAT